MNMRRLPLLACPILVLLLGVGVTARAEDDTNALVGKAAPDFSLATLIGQQVQLSGQKGKVVMVDFWATWCPPCRQSLPHVQQASANKDLAEKGLVVWAVNASEKAETVKGFLDDNHYTFTVPMDGNGAVLNKYFVHGIPTTVIVGRDGSVKAVFIGFGDGSAKQIDDAVDKALAEPAP